jgi:hypothetical protein
MGSSRSPARIVPCTSLTVPGITYSRIRCLPLDRICHLNIPSRTAVVFRARYIAFSIPCILHDVIGNKQLGMR